VPRFHSQQELDEYFAKMKLDHARAVFRNDIGMKKWAKFWRDDYRRYADEQRKNR